MAIASRLPARTAPEPPAAHGIISLYLYPAPPGMGNIITKFVNYFLGISDKLWY